MHRILLYGLTLLCGQASASVIHQQIISEFESCDITPAWERTNDLSIVPLVPEARTGLVSPEVEEGLIYARQFLLFCPECLVMTVLLTLRGCTD
jgi:hypothetical protein